MSGTTRVERAARQWWASKRPLEWDWKQHLESPCVNCTTVEEKTLALAVSQQIMRKSKVFVLPKAEP